jgi:hypothetical protein
MDASKVPPAVPHPMGWGLARVGVELTDQVVVFKIVERVAEAIPHWILRMP